MRNISLQVNICLNLLFVGKNNNSDAPDMVFSIYFRSCNKYIMYIRCKLINNMEYLYKQIYNYLDVQYKVYHTIIQTNIIIYVKIKTILNVHTKIVN